MASLHVTAPSLALISPLSLCSLLLAFSAFLGLSRLHSVSICFFRDEWRPDSFYDKIKVNMAAQFHTLCLLDIKVKEQSFENMAKSAHREQAHKHSESTRAQPQHSHRALSRARRSLSACACCSRFFPGASWCTILPVT